MGKNLHTKFVGMDVHQKSISIALADDGPDGEVRLYGKISNTPEAIDKLIVRRQSIWDKWALDLRDTFPKRCRPDAMITQGPQTEIFPLALG